MDEAGLPRQVQAGVHRAGPLEELGAVSEDVRLEVQGTVVLRRPRSAWPVDSNNLGSHGHQRAHRMGADVSAGTRDEYALHAGQYACLSRAASHSWAPG